MSTKPVTKPRWALTGAGADAANLATPSSGEQDTGYTANQVPTSGKLNWLFNWLAKWINFLDDSPNFAPTTANAPGLKATGAATNGDGVQGQGTGTGKGGSFTGGGTGVGIAAAGGATSGDGVTGTGTAGNSRGGNFTGQGSAEGALATGGATGPGLVGTAGGGGSPARGALNLVPQVAPSAPANGDFWSTAAAFFARIAGNTFTMALLEAAQTFTGAITFGPGGTNPGLAVAPGGGATPTRGHIALGNTVNSIPSGAANGDMWAETTSQSLGIRLNGTNRNIYAQALVQPTYGVSVAIDGTLGTFFSILATNGTAFTITNPTSAIAGRRITVRVANTSGGALGAITWGASYRMSAWTNPANGFSRSIDFIYDGTTWFEVSRTPADVPN